MSERKWIIQIIFVLIGLIFAIKLFTIQVLDSNYKEAAENNIVQKVVEYPFRGLIYDRNGELMVYNQPVFDIMVIPKEIEIEDTATFCRLFLLEKEDLINKIAAAEDYSYVKPSIFLKKFPMTEFSRIQDELIDFEGFYPNPRTVRGYTHDVAANALGYIGEIDRRELAMDTSDYYRSGDNIGKSGIEKTYERFLRGKRGVTYKMVNVQGIEKGSFKDGKFDTLPIPGQNIMSTLDLELQKYGEYLMEGKIGSVVAIEPSTGEILAFVSGPSYDPHKLTGRNYSSNFLELSTDTLKPLFNRPLMAQYRPGSIFKIMQAMIALQEGVIYPGTRITCNRNIIGCHGAHSYEDLSGAITHSCNPYFYSVMKRVVNQEVVQNTYEDTRIGLEKWRSHVATFGFGSPLGVDIPNEKGGMIPNVKYYDRAYDNQPWKYSNIYSIAIGEGENLIVPLQMANFAAIVANRGFYYTPHLVKSIGESGEPLPEYQIKHETSVKGQYFDIAVEAMANVVQSGTGQYRAKLRDIEVCGKTGTVQNDPRPDHSVFIAFAPKDDPKIALSVYVESAGQGARAAASIASLMIEKYLIGDSQRPYIEDYVLKGDFL